MRWKRWHKRSRRERSLSARKRTKTAGFGLRLRIADPASLLKSYRASLSRSSAPSQKEREWDWPFAVALLKHTMAVCGQNTPLMAAPSFSSPSEHRDESEDRAHSTNLPGSFHR